MNTKKSKMDTTLNEKDALQDMLDIEKLLMSYYSAALLEGSCKPFRKAILKNYTTCADTQFQVFEQMLSREYYQVQPAEKLLIDQKTDSFSKVKKQIAVNE